ncbi:thiosulfate sulfurtransferase 18-like [Lotus japonicus]|uniref:Rhodanese domain-containing protein n=1 Tax=Lotus japonicus TaxID=34305 RepID=I3T7S9_LOTJA|nr:thiosulfate sulfurtransferase 18-like [Lotus japonicus]AFK48571.1 unknown [Lotus japonicus]
MAVSRTLLPRWSPLVLLPFVFCISAAKVVTVDVHAAKRLIQNGHTYLDVRTVNEFVEGHVDAAKIINIPYMIDTPKGRVKNQDFLKEVSSVFSNKEDHLIVGCKSGVRSLSATADLLANGYKNVNDMGGGYMDWVRNKFPVNAPADKEEL